METPLPRKKIAALIPCYNEEKSIGAVIKSFPQEKLRTYGYELEVIVINNASSDKTADVARAHGATVIHEPKKGKGNAIRTGFYNISKDCDFVVMLDGDDTYRPQEIVRLIEPLDSGFCNVVIGSRLGGRISDGSMTSFNRAGNWIFTHLARYIYRVNVTDVLTGYFAWKREAIERLRPHLSSSGFAIEMEMITKMARLGEEIYSVPISYDARVGNSSLRPIYDGSRILFMLMRTIAWKPKKKVRRIAFVSDAVMPYHIGGKEKRLWEIARRLVSEEQEVHIYTMQWWEGPKTISQDGMYLHAISKLHPLYVGGRRSIKQAVLFGLATFKLLFVRFDVLDVDHMPLYPLFSARVVTWVRGKTLHATWHELWGREYWTTYLGAPLGFLGHLTERLSLKMPDVIISNSLHTTERLREAGVRAIIKTVPLGAGLADILGAPLGRASDIIFVGRLLNHKNADLLVRAVEIVKRTQPEISALIVGTGPEKARIAGLIKELGLQENICILDTTDTHESLYGLMKASKMLVLPSVREGFGIVVVEAHASGIPVITTSHKDNAAKELIREGINGFLSEPNERDLAKKILHLLDVRETLEPRRFVGQYDWSEVAQNMVRAFG